MFDLVHKYKRLTQIVLALIALPFAFFGVDYYFRRGDITSDVAQVGSKKITQIEFDNALRDQQERMRQQLGAGVDPAMLDTPELRYALLERLVTERLLTEKARRETIRVTDAQLQQVIGSIPAFQVGGKFSIERYREILSSQGMSSLQFEDRMRQQLLLAPIEDPVSSAHFVARPAALRYLDLSEQEREVAAAPFDLEPFTKGVTVDEPAIKAFYEANPRMYEIAEQIRFEYLVVNLDSLMAGLGVGADEIKAAYEATARQYAQEEQRAAAHILISVKPDAPAAEKEAAKKKAEQVAAEVRANPARFAELAKKVSQDPGSAPQGGELGSFARGNMVKSFDDAVFAMKVGDISPPVLSEFGWHVIKLEAITPARVRPFDEVKGQLEADLKRQKAGQKFAAIADQLQNLVYEQADSLAGAAKALGVPVLNSPWSTRAQAQAIALGSPKFVDALFSAESIQSKRNTEAIEVAPNAVMAGRVLEHKAATPRPLADVHDDIRREIARRTAAELAQKGGGEKLAMLTAGKSDKEAGVAFGAVRSIRRNGGGPGFSPDALRRIFEADPSRLPAFVGALNDRGAYTIYRVSKVVTPPSPDDAKVAGASARIREQVGRAMMNAYVAALKAHADVTINQANLEKK